jgi:hypothetical protein
MTHIFSKILPTVQYQPHWVFSFSFYIFGCTVALDAYHRHISVKSLKFFYSLNDLLPQLRDFRIRLFNFFEEVMTKKERNGVSFPFVVLLGLRVFVTHNLFSTSLSLLQFMLLILFCLFVWSGFLLPFIITTVMKR